MPRFYRVVLAVLLLAVLATAGCARAARDTTGFAVHQELTVKAPFDKTWQAVKEVLRDQGYTIYTRDKRGTFVAYSDVHRFLLVQPRRIKYTVEVKTVDPEQTAITVDAVRQIYGVTLLTYPDWHDRKLKDEKATAELFEAVQGELAGTRPAEAEKAKDGK